jgi:thiamine monophosphate synthase
MSNLSRLEAAQRGLLAAVDTSLKASRCRNAAQRADIESAARAAAHEAELKLILEDRRDLATRLEAVVTRDMTTPEARRELREVAQLLDAELSPAVSTDSFRAASDGGARE